MLAAWVGRDQLGTPQIEALEDLACCLLAQRIRHCRIAP
jgi:hypothetical protein